jgi:predicted nucleic acid-binding protein
MPPDPLPRILLDADVLSHFIKGGQAGLLNAVFPNRLVILDEVMRELDRVSRFNQPLNILIKLSNITIVSFADDDEVLMEFGNLLRQYLGRGESACMATARYHGDFIASSNLKDITRYCKQHGITYYTTLDILHFAVQDGHLTVDDCNTFITTIKKLGSKPGFDSYQQYLKAGPRSR